MNEREQAPSTTVMTEQEHAIAAEVERLRNEQAGTAWKRRDLERYCANCGWETFGTIHECRPPAEESA